MRPGAVSYLTHENLGLNNCRDRDLSMTESYDYCKLEGSVKKQLREGQGQPIGRGLAVEGALIVQYNGHFVPLRRPNKKFG